MELCKYYLHFLMLIGFVFCATASFMNVYNLRESRKPQCDDCGEPLYLSSYISSGKLKEGRQLAKVFLPDFHKMTSYSGFLTVNESHHSNMFFWYFPSQSAPEDPVVLWLQGGPGASSLYGLFSENGPFEYRKKHLFPRRYSWSNNHHLIYIDNPVGTGFSDTVDGYAQNETAVGQDLYTALYQFFQLFPDLQNNEFYVTGESYAGKYVPAVCYTIHKKNIDAKMKINLKGFGIGNGLSDPLNQLRYAPYLYQLGLIDGSGMDQVDAYEKKGIEFIKAEKWMDAYHIFDTLLNGDETKYPSMFFNLTGFKYYFNYLYPEDNTHSDDFVELFDRSCVRRGLHVGNMTFHVSGDVEKNLQADLMQSVAGWVSELLAHYRGVIYNGQLDIIVAYPLTENYLRVLNFTSADEWKQAIRKQWRVDGELAGFAKTVGNLTEVLVRDAGHMVPADQPKWAADLVSRLTRNKPFF